MSWVNNVRAKNPIYQRRCKYCKSELAVIDTKSTEFKKPAPALLCPRCDGPSPPTPLGTNPDNQEAPSD